VLIQQQYYSITKNSLVTAGTETLHVLVDKVLDWSTLHRVASNTRSLLY